jgi:hypothetical protein
MAQVVEYLPCKCEAFSSNPSSAKKKIKVPKEGMVKQFIDSY